MQLVTLPSGLRPSSVGKDDKARLHAAKVVGVAGVLAYNWWVVVPFVPGLMPSVNGFFSDLEATGRPHATLMSDADLCAGILLVGALLLRGSSAGNGARREWKWMVAFALAGAIGGRYPYACAEGLSAACRQMEWHLQLPLHHYVHVVSGIAEFATLTTAAFIAHRRTRHDGTVEARIYAAVVRVLVVGYPLLGLVYITDRLGTLVEPIFFVAFSTMVLAELFEPISRHPAPEWSRRVMERGGEEGGSIAAAWGDTPTGQSGPSVGTQPPEGPGGRHVRV
jgi:hypothetical protein